MLCQGSCPQCFIEFTCVHKPCMFILFIVYKKKCNDNDVFMLCIGIFRDIVAVFAEINAL